MKLEKYLLILNNRDPIKADGDIYWTVTMEDIKQGISLGIIKECILRNKILMEKIENHQGKIYYMKNREVVV